MEHFSGEKKKKRLVEMLFFPSGLGVLNNNIVKDKILSKSETKFEICSVQGELTFIMMGKWHVTSLLCSSGSILHVCNHKYDTAEFINKIN